MLATAGYMAFKNDPWMLFVIREDRAVTHFFPYSQYGSNSTLQQMGTTVVNGACSCDLFLSFVICSSFLSYPEILT